MKKVKKFYIYSSSDRIEFSQQIEKYLNNNKITIVDINFQSNNVAYPIIDREPRLGEIKINDRRYYENVIATQYTAFITYIEN